MELSRDEIRRYSRRLILPEAGLAGQKKIKSTSVLCIGTGGGRIRTLPPKGRDGALRRHCPLGGRNG